jgi:hypothetical protein
MGSTGMQTCTVRGVEKPLDGFSRASGMREENAERRAAYQAEHRNRPERKRAVRDLLCLDCNQGLGELRDSPDLLLRALVYLRQRSAPVA